MEQEGNRNVATGQEFTLQLETDKSVYHVFRWVIVENPKIVEFLRYDFSISDRVGS